jgi:hypothetical protein
MPYPPELNPAPYTGFSALMVFILVYCAISGKSDYFPPSCIFAMVINLIVLLHNRRCHHNDTVLSPISLLGNPSPWPQRIVSLF